MIKIFISSTFIDMHYERDMIQLKILPEMKRKAETVGESVDFCDLRWGINTLDIKESERMDKILQVCFREISECSNCDSHTFMIVLLGERYGSLPDENRIDEIVKRMNLESPSRVFHHSDVEGKSYTNLEIEYAPFTDDNMFRRTIFLFRDPIENAPSNYQGTEEDKKKLDSLKESIMRKTKKLGLNNIIKYNLKWDENLQKPLELSLNAFITVLTDKLFEMIESDLSKYSMLTDEDKACKRHWLFVNKKARLYNEGNDLLEKLDLKLQEGIKEIYIQGPSGSGKSCLLCKFIEKKKKDGWNVYPFICSGKSGSVTKLDIYIEWIAFFENILKNKLSYLQKIKSLSSYEEKVKEAYSHLLFLFKQYSETDNLPPLLLAIDAGDKVDTGENHVYSLKFVPFEYSKIRFICSSTTNQLLGIDTNDEYHYFVQHSKKYVNLILEGYMNYIQKFLPEEIKTLIIEKCMNKSPYYIQLLFKRLTLLDATDFANGTDDVHQLENYKRIVNEMPETEIEFSKELLNIIASKTNQKTIETVIRYVAVSTSGLRRFDLQNLIERKNLIWDNADFSILINFFDEMFDETIDGRFDFVDDKLKSSITNNEDTFLLRKEIYEYLQDLPLEDHFRVSCILDYCFYADDKPYLVEMIQNQYLYNIDFVKSFNAGAYSDKLQWFISILENPLTFGINRRMVQFVVNQFHRYPVYNAQLLMKSVYDAIVAYCESSEDVLPSDAAIAQLIRTNESHGDNQRDIIYEGEKTLEMFKNMKSLTVIDMIHFANTYLMHIHDLIVRKKYEQAYTYLNEFLIFLQNGIKKDLFWCGQAAVLYYNLAELYGDLVENKYEYFDDNREAKLEEVIKYKIQFYNESMKLLIQEKDYSLLKCILTEIKEIFAKILNLFNLKYSNESEITYYANSYIPFIFDVASFYKDDSMFTSLSNIYMEYSKVLIKFNKIDEAYNYIERSLKIVHKVEENGLNPQMNIKDIVEKCIESVKNYLTTKNYENAVTNGIKGIKWFEKYLEAYKGGGVAFETLTGFDVFVKAAELYGITADALINCGKNKEAYSFVQEGLQWVDAYDGEGSAVADMPDNITMLFKSLKQLWYCDEIETQKIVEDVKFIDKICSLKWLKVFEFFHRDYNFLEFSFYLNDKAIDACKFRNEYEIEANLLCYRIKKTKKCLKEKRSNKYNLKIALFTSSVALGEAYAKLEQYNHVLSVLLPYKRKFKKEGKIWKDCKDRYMAMNCYDLIAFSIETYLQKNAKSYRRKELNIFKHSIFQYQNTYYFANYINTYLNLPNELENHIVQNKKNLQFYNEYGQKALYRQAAVDYIGIGIYYENNNCFDKAKENYELAIQKCSKALELLGEDIDYWMKSMCFNMLGQCLSKMGDVTAFQYYNQALEYLNHLKQPLVYKMDDCLVVLCNRAFSVHVPNTYSPKMREEDLKQAKAYSKELLRLTGLARYKTIIKLINTKESIK